MLFNFTSSIVQRLFNVHGSYYNMLLIIFHMWRDVKGHKSLMIYPSGLNWRRPLTILFGYKSSIKVTFHFLNFNEKLHRELRSRSRASRCELRLSRCDMRIPLRLTLLFNFSIVVVVLFHVNHTRTGLCVHIKYVPFRVFTLVELALFVHTSQF